MSARILEDGRGCERARELECEGGLVRVGSNDML